MCEWPRTIGTLTTIGHFRSANEKSSTASDRWSRSPVHLDHLRQFRELLLLDLINLTCIALSESPESSAFQQVLGVQVRVHPDDASRRHRQRTRFGRGNDSDDTLIMAKEHTDEQKTEAIAPRLGVYTGNYRDLPSSSLLLTTLKKGTFPLQRRCWCVLT